MRLSIPNKEKESKDSVRNKIIQNRINLLSNENTIIKSDDK